jgi:prevent-host-death family protein
MQKTIQASELPQRIDELLDEVARNGVQYIVARDNGPEAALISYESLLRLQQLEHHEQQVRERWARARAELATLNAGYSEEEVAADVESAREEVWAMRRELRP